MKKDLLVITPSRGRPDRLREMLAATLGKATRTTQVAVALDSDDAHNYMDMALPYKGDWRVRWFTGPRKSLTEWTNYLALELADEYTFLASHGDDHIPRSVGWDHSLMSSLFCRGTQGIAYANDLNQKENLPTSVMISSGIVKALGWFALPSCHHFYIDNVWKDLGKEAGCLSYREDVHIEHLHPAWGTASTDRTYTEASNWWDQDGAAYQEWSSTQKASDVERVKSCLISPLSPKESSR